MAGQGHPNINAAITKAAQNNQVVMIGETDHSSSGIRTYLTSPELLDAAQKGGIRHVFLEVPVRLQHIADRLSAGEIDREGFVDQMYSLMKLYNDDKAFSMHSKLAELILESKARGIKVHFGDQHDAGARGDQDSYLYFKAIEGLEKKYTKEDVDFFREKLEDTLDHVDMSDPSYLTDSLSSIIKRNPSAAKILEVLPPATRENFLKMADEFRALGRVALSDARLNETDSVKYALEVAGDQKFMMIWGAAHDRPRDYLDKLGIKNHTIDIIDPNGKNANGYTGEKEPDTKAVLTEDRVIPTNSNAAPATPRPAAALQPAL